MARRSNEIRSREASSPENRVLAYMEAQALEGRFEFSMNELRLALPELSQGDLWQAVGHLEARGHIGPRRIGRWSRYSLTAVRELVRRHGLAGESSSTDSSG